MEQVKRRMEKLVRELKEEGCLLKKDYYYHKIDKTGTEFYQYEIYLNGFNAHRFGIKLGFKSPDRIYKILKDKKEVKIYEILKDKKEVKNINLKDYVLYENGEDESGYNNAHCVHLRNVKIKFLDLDCSWLYCGYNLVHKSQLYKIFAIYKKLFIYMYDCFMHFLRFRDDTLIVTSSIYNNNLFYIYKVIRFVDRNDVKYKKFMRNMVERGLYSSNKYSCYVDYVRELQCTDSESKEFDIIINKVEEQNKILKRIV